jgi:Protein of unknown function (DUF2505)
MRITHTSRHTATPDEVVEVLCSEAYNIEVEKGREGVVETRFEPIAEDESRRAFRLVTTEYARTKTGGLDRSRTLSSTTDSELDARKRELTWRYASKEGSRVRLSGSLRVVPDGTGARVEQSVDIEVSIPLIGGQIAKLIGKEFEKTFPKTVDILKRHLAK